MRNYHAIFVGVAEPNPFDFAGRHYAFSTLQGVIGDVDFYVDLVQKSTGSRLKSTQRLVDPGVTTRGQLLSRLAVTVRTMGANDVLVLVLVGHGFQIAAVGGDEPDGKDEVFAASNMPIVDNEFGEIWRQLPDTAAVVIFADTCSSESIGTLGGVITPPHITVPENGPSRLSLSASMDAEEANEVPTRHGVRGVFSRYLEAVWTDERPTSYLAWFEATSLNVNASRPLQHPQLHYAGLDRRFLEAQPFT